MDTLLELINGMSGKVFSLIIQVLISTAIAMYVKDLAVRLINYIKLEFSDFGRGTKIEFEGKVGYITKITFRQVEVRIDDKTILIIPTAKFLDSPKIIFTKASQNEDD